MINRLDVGDVDLVNDCDIYVKPLPRALLAWLFWLELELKLNLCIWEMHYTLGSLRGEPRRS